MQDRHLISTGSPFEKLAGYSRAVVQGSWIFVSGTTGYDYKTMMLSDDVSEQTHQCFATIAAVLEQAESSLKDIVRVNYVVSRREDAETVLKIAGHYLGEIRPAAMIIVAGLLQEQMKVEIEVTALRR